MVKVINYLDVVEEVADIEASDLNLLFQIVKLCENAHNNIADWAWCYRLYGLQLVQKSVQNCADTLCISTWSNLVQFVEQIKYILQLNRNWSSYSSAGDITTVVTLAERCRNLV